MFSLNGPNTVSHSSSLQTILTGVDYQWGSSSDTFATCGSNVGIWSIHRTEPLRCMTLGVDTITSLVFNKVRHALYLQLIVIIIC